MSNLIVSSSILCLKRSYSTEMNDIITTEFIKNLNFFLKFSYFFSCSMMKTTSTSCNVIEISNSTDSLFFNVTTFVIIIEIQHLSVCVNLFFQWEEVHNCLWHVKLLDELLFLYNLQEDDESNNSLCIPIHCHFDDMNIHDVNICSLTP